MIVVGLPSAEVTNFRMVPAGKGPLVYGKRRNEEFTLHRNNSLKILAFQEKFICIYRIGSLNSALSCSSHAIMDLSIMKHGN